MARFHKGLVYHDDKVEKHSITKEEIGFLLELQKEMNTQDTLCQADPRYWVIRGYEKQYCIEDGYEDGTDLIDDDCSVVVACDMKEALEYIQDNILEEVNSRDGVKRTLVLEDNLTLRISWKKDGEVYDKILSEMKDVAKWLEEQGYGNYRCINYRKTPKIYDNTMFLTQKDAEEHLRQNHYHYSSDAHTFAMTSWRSKVSEKLWKILQEVD